MRARRRWVGRGRGERCNGCGEPITPRETEFEIDFSNTHPGEARFETMPATAIAEDDVDAMLTVDELAIVLAALARGDAIEARRPTVTP